MHFALPGLRGDAMTTPMTNEQAATQVFDLRENSALGLSPALYEALRMAEAALRAQGWQPIKTQGESK